MKTKKLFQPDGKTLGGILFWCPGCKCAHHFGVREVVIEGVTKYPATSGQLIWAWNGDMEKPTFSPSLLHYRLEGEHTSARPRCHIFVKDGVIDFLSDCEHELAGKKVPLVDIPKDSGWVDE